VVELEGYEMYLKIKSQGISFQGLEDRRPKISRNQISGASRVLLPPLPSTRACQGARALIT
jgi:hypothetical protein